MLISQVNIQLKYLNGQSTNNYVQYNRLSDPLINLKLGTIVLTIPDYGLWRQFNYFMLHLY